MESVRAINSHLASFSSYCYVHMVDGRCMRISRARTRAGVVEGRVINVSGSWDHRPNAWEPIPPDSTVELV